MEYKLDLKEYNFGLQLNNIRLEPAIPRIIYGIEGTALLDADCSVTNRLKPNTALYYNGSLDIKVEGIKTTILIWEVVGTPTRLDDNLESNCVQVKTKFQSDINLDVSKEYIIRCDRVDFPLGGIAYTHTHKGPGIRYLLSGSLEVMVNQNKSYIAPNQAWFETGPEHVYAVASDKNLTSFVRVMVLPISTKGLKSIEYVLEEDHDKPKLQKYTMFIDSELCMK